MGFPCVKWKIVLPFVSLCTVQKSEFNGFFYNSTVLTCVTFLHWSIFPFLCLICIIKNLSNGFYQVSPVGKSFKRWDPYVINHMWYKYLNLVMNKYYFLINRSCVLLKIDFITNPDINRTTGKVFNIFKLLYDIYFKVTVLCVK